MKKPILPMNTTAMPAGKEVREQKVGRERMTNRLWITIHAITVLLFTLAAYPQSPGFHVSQITSTGVLMVRVNETFYDGSDGVIFSKVPLPRGATALQFRVTGGVDTDGSWRVCSADGLSASGTVLYNFTATSWAGTYQGIPVGSTTGIDPGLFGVFFDPLSGGTPANSENFRGDSGIVPDPRRRLFYAPSVNQPFWIGDGYDSNNRFITAGDALLPGGTIQTFNIPIGATYILLGIGADDRMSDNVNGPNSVGFRVHVFDDSPLTNATPEILEQPVGLTAYVGMTVRLQVIARGSWPMAFQWCKDTTPLNGQTSAWLTLANATLVDTGDYTVLITNAFGSVTSAVARLTVVVPPTHYVSLESTNPMPPYTNWATAAINIQDAVNVAASPDVIVVSNGAYAGGVSVTNRLMLLSVNGPKFTLINGRRTNPCVNLADGASLTGFTLSNGQRGVYCASTSAFLTNCVIVGNSPYGGAYRGTLYNCTLAGNSHSDSEGHGGGADASTLYNCTLTNNLAYEGAGAYLCTLRNCTLTGNSAYSGGGGTSQSSLYNCVLSGNSLRHDGSGGGANGSTLYNCTLTGNSAAWGGGANGSTLYNCTLTGNLAAWGGGAHSSTLYNSIVYFNEAQYGPNYYGDEWGPIVLAYCCTTPLPTNGVGNIALDPQLASASHLSADSPCRGAGSAPYASGTDIDGEPWGNPPSIGCDEFHPEGLTGPLAVGLSANYTNVTLGYPVSLTALIEGRLTHSVWAFGDGTTATNEPCIVHTWTQPGDYLVALCAFNESHLPGVCASITIHVLAEHAVYVSSTSTNPQPPYISWATAATTIQDAVAVPQLGYSLIIVSNGVYSGHVRVSKPLTLLSVNGPQVTVIDGAGESNPCVNLADGASLTGFTLTNGLNGVYCSSRNAFVTNCVIMGNSAARNGLSVSGGGAYQGTLYNCTVTGNSAAGYWVGPWWSPTYYAGEGGGAYGSTLYNCTLSGNSSTDSGGGVYWCILYNCSVSGNAAKAGGGAVYSQLYNCTVTGNSATGSWDSGYRYYRGEGGGAYGSTLYNCIVYFNAASGAANYDTESTLDYCCTVPLPTNGVGNIALDPQLATASHLSADSPCRGAALAAYTRGADIDGEDWGIPPSMGCDEFHAEASTGPLAVALTANYTNVVLSYPVSLTAAIEGRLTQSVWAFGDGTMATNKPYIVHTWTEPGDYLVTLCAFNGSHLLGVCASVTIHVLAEPGVCVSSTSTNPQPPYASWATAAITIQDALDVPQVGYSLIIVSNGLYSGGVTVTKPLTLLSVNGPQVTVIDGAGGGWCVFLADGASLTGFTLTNGITGVACSSTNAFVTNCVIVGNSAVCGGGAYQGTLYNCALTSNSAIGYRSSPDLPYNDHPGLGGGAYGSTLYNCTLTANSSTDYGGGADSSTLYNCTFTANSADDLGGGACGCTLYNCTLTGNSAGSGGGAGICTLLNCTLTGNSGLGAAGGALYNCTVTGNAGGVAGAALYNSILYFNAAAGAPNYDANSTLNYCCTAPLPTSGVGNITNAPLFIDYADGNLRLQSSSPCINAGNNGYLTNYDESWGLWFTNQCDLDGRPRLVGASVDMGAYEFQPRISGLFIAWLEQFGLPTDGSADFVDFDLDGHNNWQEWVCGTCPTNAASALRLLSALPTGTNVTVSWQSAAGINYFLERSDNLAEPFTLLATNIVGQAGTTTYSDTNATDPGPVFYRVGAANR